MLKLQKQHNTRTHSTQSASTNNEIFRKVRLNILSHVQLIIHNIQKLQHVKSESEREVASLKRKVEDLERQLKSGTRPTAKRTKFM